MTLRVIFFSVILLSLASCNKKKTAAALSSGTLDFSFFDEFDRADGDFSTETNYNAWPSTSSVLIYNQAVRGLSSLQNLQVTYKTAATGNSAGATVTARNVGTTVADLQLVMLTDTDSYLTANEFAYCGFTSSGNLRFYEDGLLVMNGSETFDFSDGSERTIVLLYDGTKFICVATDGTTVEELEYTSTYGLNLHYLAFYSGDPGGRSIHMDDFGVIDMSSYTGRTNAVELAKRTHQARRAKR